MKAKSLRGKSYVQLTTAALIFGMAWPAIADTDNTGTSPNDASAGALGAKPDNPAVMPGHKHPGPPALKPGQKLKISGYADQQEPVVIDESGSISSPNYHRAQMRLSGSMCYACLHELQEKLRHVYGVERVKVEKTEQVSLQASAPVLPSWADGVVFFDSSKVDLQDLRAYIRTLGYFPYKVSDKSVDSIPSESQKKI